MAGEYVLAVRWLRDAVDSGRSSSSNLTAERGLLLGLKAFGAIIQMRSSYSKSGSGIDIEQGNLSG
jgi:hypothetical protein